MSYKYCCDEFETAVRRYAPEDPAVYAWRSKWCIRADEFVIKHCPFCGVTLRAPPVAIRRSREPQSAEHELNTPNTVDATE